MDMPDDEPSFQEEYPFFAFILRELDELRRRLLWCLGALALCSGALLALPSWDHSYIMRLSAWLRAELLPAGAKLIFLSPLEPMAQMIKLALVLSVLLCLPLLLWHFLAFTRPALPEGLRGFYARFLVLAVGLLGLGLAFSGVFLAPLTFKILLDYGANAGGEAQLTFERFYSFIAVLLLAFAIPFELPLLMGFLHRFNLVSADWFAKNRFRAWGVILLISQFVMPDPLVTPLIFTGMGIVLYEGGLHLGKWL